MVQFVLYLHFKAGAFQIGVFKGQKRKLSASFGKPVFLQNGKETVQAGQRLFLPRDARFQKNTGKLRIRSDGPDVFLMYDMAGGSDQIAGKYNVGTKTAWFGGQQGKAVEDIAVYKNCPAFFKQYF